LKNRSVKHIGRNRIHCSNNYSHMKQVSAQYSGVCKQGLNTSFYNIVAACCGDIRTDVQQTEPSESSSINSFL